MELIMESNFLFKMFGLIYIGKKFKKCSVHLRIPSINHKVTIWHEAHNNFVTIQFYWVTESVLFFGRITNPERRKWKLGFAKNPNGTLLEGNLRFIILYLVRECVYKYFPLRQYKAHNPTANVSEHSLQKTVEPSIKWTPVWVLKFSSHNYLEWTCIQRKPLLSRRRNQY